VHYVCPVWANLIETHIIVQLSWGVRFGWGGWNVSRITEDRNTKSPILSLFTRGFAALDSLSFNPLFGFILHCLTKKLILYLKIFDCLSIYLSYITLTFKFYRELSTLSIPLLLCQNLTLSKIIHLFLLCFNVNITWVSCVCFSKIQEAINSFTHRHV